MPAKATYIKGTSTILMKEHSTYGFKDMDDNYWNFGNKVTKEQFIPGTTYKVDWYQKEGGKYKYIDKAVAITAGAPAVAAPAKVYAQPTPAAGKPAIRTDSMSRETSIERQAVLKSVLESPVLAKLTDSVEDAEVLISRLFKHSYKLFKGE